MRSIPEVSSSSSSASSSSDSDSDSDDPVARTPEELLKAEYGAKLSSIEAAHRRKLKRLTNTIAALQRSNRSIADEMRGGRMLQKV
eukprot:g5375.t1